MVGVKEIVVVGGQGQRQSHNPRTATAAGGHNPHPGLVVPSLSLHAGDDALAAIRGLHGQRRTKESQAMSSPRLAVLYAAIAAVQLVSSAAYTPASQVVLDQTSQTSAILRRIATDPEQGWDAHAVVEDVVQVGGDVKVSLVSVAPLQSLS